MKIRRPEIKPNVGRITKISSINGEEINLSSSLIDSFDNAIKFGFNITDEEYDFICENATEEDLENFVLNLNPSFSDRRKALEIRNKYLKIFNEQIRMEITKEKLIELAAEEAYQKTDYYKPLGKTMWHQAFKAGVEWKEDQENKDKQPLTE